MKRILYYFFKLLSLLIRLIRNRKLYMLLLRKAHEINGVKFNGIPKFIHPNVVLDGTAELVLGDNIVISTGVLFLTHDYSYTAGLISINEKPYTDIAIIKSTIVGDNCFIGANSTILLGSKIGSNVIIGAGSVVRGNIPDYSLVSGNPANIICDIRDWTNKKKANLKINDLLIDKK